VLGGKVQLENIEKQRVMSVDRETVKPEKETDQLPEEGLNILNAGKET